MTELPLLMRNDTESSSNRPPPLEAAALARFHEALPFVENIARGFLRRLDARHGLDDLIAAGREGLLEAVRKFDPEHGCPFQGYAYLRIRGEIIAHIRRTQLPRRAYQRKRVRYFTGCESVHALSEAEFEIANGQRPVGVSPSAAEGTLDAALARYVTAAALGMGPTTATEGALVREEAAERSPELEYQKHELHALLRDEVGRLPPDEAAVLNGLYFRHRGLSEIASEMDCDKSWACRLHRRAIERLSKRIRTSRIE